MPCAARLVSISTIPKHICARAWSGTNDSALVNFASAAAKAAEGSSRQTELRLRSRPRAPMPIERVDVVGIERRSRDRKSRAPAPHCQGSCPLLNQASLGNRGPSSRDSASFRASRLGGDELGVQRARQPRDDFVLHVEEIGERLVEPLGPEMVAGLGVDELHVDAHAVSAALDAAFEDIADVQLAADLFQIDGFALVGEGGVAPDHERAANARKIGRQALGDPVDEMLLLRIAADIGERQDDDREARRVVACSARGRSGAGAVLSVPILTA